MTDKQKELQDSLQQQDADDAVRDNIKFMDALSRSSVLVPGMDARKKDTFAAIHEENLLMKMDMPVLPDLLKAEDGRSFYPVFTSMEEAPEEYRKYFEWIEIEFTEMCYFAAHSEIANEIIINPFTNSLIMPEPAVEQFAALWAAKMSQA